MSNLLSDVGTFFTQLIGWGGQLIELIMDNSILLLFVAGFTVAGFVIGWVARLFRSN